MSAPLEESADRDAIVGLADQVNQLRDLFQRRLFEDKAKNRLYDELHEQLQLARGGLAEQLLAPLFREVLLVVDRVSSLAGPDDVVLSSVIDELLDLLERRDVRPVPVAEDFDPSVHEAVAAEVDPTRPAGSIIRVVRPGYTMGRTLLRPERVVVAAAPQPTPASEGATAPTTEVEL